MKAKLIAGMATLSGKAGDVVYCVNRVSGVMYCRRNTYPTLNDNHHKMGSIAKNLSKLDLSTEYIEDLKRYAYYYQFLRQKRSGSICNRSNVLTKMMYALAKTYPDVDLQTITKEYIYDHSLPIITVKQAVEAGLLQKVDEYKTMNHNM